MNIKSYLISVGDAISQLANKILLNGNPNESLSGRAYRTGSRWEKAINILLFDKQHCEKSHNNDIDYALWLIANQDSELDGFESELGQ